MSTGNRTYDTLDQYGDSRLVENADGTMRRVGLSPFHDIEYPEIRTCSHDTAPYNIALYGGVFGQIRPGNPDEIVLAGSDAIDDEDLVERTINVLSHEYMHCLLMDIIGEVEVYNGLDNLENSENLLRNGDLQPGFGSD